jgi:hypothetical protein
MLGSRFACGKSNAVCPWCSVAISAAIDDFKGNHFENPRLTYVAYGRGSGAQMDQQYEQDKALVVEWDSCKESHAQMDHARMWWTSSCTSLRQPQVRMPDGH